MDFPDELCCPLCTEPLDATDRACEFCQCGYAMCLWCWHQLMENSAKENLPGRCPNCRAIYDKEKITQQAMEPSQLEEVAREAQRRKPERKPSGNLARPRRDLATVRVVQRNLVYVVGLAMDICHEDTLRSSEYFGQFGKPVKVSVNRAMPTGMAHAKGGASGSAYVTFRRPQDAQRCVETVDGITWSGRVVRACFGTTKYCNAFLKGIVCNNTDCLYLHAVADDADSFTKEAMLSGTPTFSKFASLTQLPAKGARPAGAAAAVHLATASSSVTQPIAPPPPGPGLQRSATLPASSSRPVAGGGHMGGAAVASDDTGPRGAEYLDGAAGSSSGGGPGSWAAVFAAPSTPVAVPPPRPPGEPSSDQEWPTLGGSQGAAVALAAAASGSAAAPAPAGAGPLANGHSVAACAAAAAEQSPGEAAPDGRNGETMAVQLARAYSAPVKQANGGGRSAAKKAQQSGSPARGRAAKTLVPPPPPLTSSPASDSAQGSTTVSLATPAAQSKAISMQLKKSPSRSAAAKVAAESAPRQLAQSAAEAPARSAALASAVVAAREVDGNSALQPAMDSSSASATQAAGVLGTGRPRSKPSGPPPGFDRVPAGAAAAHDGEAAAMTSLQHQGASDGGYGGQHALQSLGSALLGPPGGVQAAESRNGTGRTQSRFSFARADPEPAAQTSAGSGQLRAPYMPHMGLPSSTAYAPAANGFPSGKELLRQLQQSVGSGPAQAGAAGPAGMQAGPSLHDPSILSVRPAANGMQPPQTPGMGSYMPGLTSGFRPGSRGPPPGFAGYVPQQPVPPPAMVPHQNGAHPVNGDVPAQHGFAQSPQPPAGVQLAASSGAQAPAATEASPGGKSRRRKGKAAASAASPAAPQFPAAPVMDGCDTLAGRLQQAKERFYSLNS